MESIATSLQSEPAYWWLILAIMLGIGEVFLPGVFLIWIAIAAAATGLIAMLVGVDPAWQIVIFAALCLIATYGGRRWYKDNPVTSQDPLLNSRTARLVGEIVTVVEAISEGRGRVKVADGIWSCRGPDLPTGSRVRVVGAEGTFLIVEPV